MPASRTVHRLRVRGLVQGVGFRPQVWRLAREMGFAGWVRNDADGVDIVLAGAADAVARFIERLRHEAPSLARIDTIEMGEAPRDRVDGPFRILDSQPGAVRTAIGPDAAVCGDCLGELFDRAHRRHRYAFTTCTHCGPRYTIAHGLPYDRARTSLAPFPLCPACQIEYNDPADRRFHAEATCCPACGPRLALCAIDGSPIAGDPVAEAWRLLQSGRIVAIKGLGGFHLACDARQAAAVASLRRRKARPAQPFAVMATSLAVLAPAVRADAEERAVLASVAAPVVLLDKTAACDAWLPGVAPDVSALGVMLPNTPLQWLIFHEAAGRPAGRAWIDAAPPDLVLVMTSANPHGEPLVIDDRAAIDRLAGIADAVLGHNRAIVARADDSVIRCHTFSTDTNADADTNTNTNTNGAPAHAAGSAVFIRRGRGYTPTAIRLPRAGPSVIAFGGWYKNTICVTRGNEAFLSTHLGDLDNAATCAFLDETVERMRALTGIEPQIVAHDRHPDFHSTRAAHRFARAHDLPTVAVQHHHAHLAAVAAEHGGLGPAIGLALDGVGLGDEGGAWGGELLRIDGGVFERLGHLAPLPLPGGDRAAREPWRMGAAALWQLGRGEQIEARYAAQPAAATVFQMLERQLNCPPSSSAGRLFDAVAGLLGIQPVLSFEAQAAMRLEALADTYGACRPLVDGWTVRNGVLDFAPLLAVLADESNPARGAALFHATLAAALADWGAQVALAEKICTLLGAGGCWLNRRLVRDLVPRLARHGITVLAARQASPGDGGLALGQAWVAMQAPNAL